MHTAYRTAETGMASELASNSGTARSAPTTYASKGDGTHWKRTIVKADTYDPLGCVPDLTSDATARCRRADLGAIGVQGAIGGVAGRRVLLRWRIVGDLTSLYGVVEGILPGLRHCVRIRS